MATKLAHKRVHEEDLPPVMAANKGLSDEGRPAVAPAEGLGKILSEGVRRFSGAAYVGLSVIYLSMSLPSVDAAEAFGAEAQLSRMSALRYRDHPSPNFEPRKEPITRIVLHDTEGSGASAERELTNPKTQKSSHYLVMEDGTVVRLVDEAKKAWGAKKFNEGSVHIEAAGYATRDMGQAEIDAIGKLAADIARRHHLGYVNIVGHGEIDPARRTDPGINLTPMRTRIRAELGSGGAAKYVAAEKPQAPLVDAELKWVGEMVDAYMPKDFDRQLYVARCREWKVDPVLPMAQMMVASGFKDSDETKVHGYMRLMGQTGKEELAINLWDYMNRIRNGAATNATPQDKAVASECRRRLGIIAPGKSDAQINAAVSSYWGWVNSAKAGGQQMEDARQKYVDAISSIYDSGNANQHVFLGVGHFARNSWALNEVPESERTKFAIAAFSVGRPAVQKALSAARAAEGKQPSQPGKWQSWENTKRCLDQRTNPSAVSDYVERVLNINAAYRGQFTHK